MRRPVGSTFRKGIAKAGLVIAIAITSPVGFADDSEELARKAADPTASLMSLNLRYTRIPEFHGLDAAADLSQFQTVLPFRAWNTSNILRTTVNYTNSGATTDGLADVTVFNLTVFDEPWGRWGVGPVAQLLPGKDGKSDTFALGPAVGFVASRERWTYGVFNQNLFAGDIGISSLQPVIAYQLGNGWAVATGDAQWTYDWERSAFVNLPVGLLLSKVMSLGGQSVKWSINPEYNLRDQQGLPKWSVRLGFSMLVPGS
ncbi:hypothetical protein J2T57_002800 [Natronocella acetinitrilica]|uniref:Transporter n=1 Tax=Natronocella acetinitrilica TaxID=414046 RepID=A0AAE3KBJ7_9GAMM|nr:hypothetical protein [Natronocella acetinitrilica]MCP1675650.1 hypothetical protein [Natronocella acetinitrilica]